MKVGIGYDSHRFAKERRLILGGVEIPFKQGLLGHSDADALLHAICDALLGALGEGDIGKHFPDTDPSYKDISSLKLLLNIGELVDKRGYTVNNIDATVILEKPALRRYVTKMIRNIANVLHIKPDRVNIKATTNEGMGFVGRGEGIAVFAVASINKKAV